MPTPASHSAYPRQVGAHEIETALGPFDELTPIGDQSGSGECWDTRQGSNRLLLKIIVREHETGRFAREVTALARLASPRIMQVHGHGQLSTALGSFPYLLSEFVPGGSLRQRLSTPASGPGQLLRDFALALVRGLAELEGARIVHRDLKPENIILRNGAWTSPVIIDLGLSRLLDDTSFTLYPWAIGTWPYMAPEQLRAERATYRSDIWAAAVIVAEIALGSHPFRRGERAAPADWLNRLEGGLPNVSGIPTSVRDWLIAATQFRAYRRPDAEQSIELLRTHS